MNVPEQPRPLPTHPRSPYLRRRRRFRLLLATVGAVLACLVLGLGLLWHLVRQPPAFYRDFEQTLQQSPDELETLAQRVEQRVLSELDALSVDAGSTGDDAETQPGEGEADSGSTASAAVTARLDAADEAVQSHEVFLTVPEVNALLSARFADWMRFKRYDLPEQVTHPAIGIVDGTLKIGFRYESSRFSQVFSADCNIAIAESGRARMVVSRIAAGRLPVSDRLGAALAARAPEEAEIRRAAEWMGRADGHDFDPRFMTEKGQKFRVKQYKLRPDGVVLVVTPDRGLDAAEFAVAQPPQP